jgi:hypothetical protein
MVDVGGLRGGDDRGALERLSAVAEEDLPVVDLG